MIRDYHATDIESVIALWRRSSDLAHPFLSEAFQDRVQAMLRGVFEAGMAEVSVAQADDRVVGFIAMIGDQVAGLFVDPGFLGKGHGRALMEAARAGRETLTVEVFAANGIGRAFYERAGFSKLSESVHAETGQALLHLQYRA